MKHHNTQQTLSRRRFLSLSMGGILGLGAAGIGSSVWVTQVEPSQLVVTRMTIALPDLPPIFTGFTIAQISDIHFGEWMTPERMLTVVQAVNALQPDLIAITGDFVSAISPNTVSQIVQGLQALHAPAGVVAVLGNHDHWTHAPTVRQAVQQAGVWLLDNTHITIQRDGDTLHVLGVDDIWEEKHDLDAALTGVPLGAATILLAHEPDYADTAAATGRIGLQLSGHSHGGQVRLPGKGALILPYLGENYDQGLYYINNMQLYVNRGVGMIAPYVRFNCPREITLLILTV